MNPLPSGWVLTDLGQITSIVSGSTPRTGVAEYWGGDIAWITPDDLSRHRGKTIARGARSLSEAGYASCSATMMPAGSVLYTSRAPIGFVAIAAGPVCTNQGFKSFVPTEAILGDFLYWFLRYATPAIRKLGSGTTFPELSKVKAAAISIGLPPLSEQHRIVAAIEEHLSRLDDAGQSLHSATTRERALRATILDSAVTAGTPAALGSVGAIYTGSTPSTRRAEYWGGGVPFVTPSDLRPGSSIRAARRSLTQSGAQAARILPAGSLLVTCIGATIGKSSLTEMPCATNQQINALVPDELVASAGYLLVALSSPRVQRLIREQAVSTTMPILNKSKFARLTIPVPPLDEQRRIVARVQEALSATDALRTAIDRSKRRSTSLGRSILAHAFRGELVPQDPSEEAASAVLERVRAESAAASVRPRTRVRG